jgi:hypothetical protein
VAPTKAPWQGWIVLPVYAVVLVGMGRLKGEPAE